MRKFVILTPGLSVGRPRTTVTQAQLRMSDDKLDEFLQAGHAIEIHEDQQEWQQPVDTSGAETTLAELTKDGDTPASDSAPPPREQLLEQARQLGIRGRVRMTDDELAAAIAEQIAGDTAAG